MSSKDPIAGLLALLARDEPAEELHHVLQQAEERGDPRLEELRDAGLSALAVRTLLTERRRRAVTLLVAVARPAHDGGTAEMVRSCAVALTRDGGLSGQRRGDVVVLLTGAEPPASARRLARSLAAAAGCPVTVGAAGPGEGVAGMPELYQDAPRCCDVLLALDRKGKGAAQDDLGVYGLLFNLTRTAGALYVQVNTLYQRLDRVTALVGKDWRSGDTELQAHLALKVLIALDVGT